MKKILLFTLATILLASCTKQQSFDPKSIAEQCMREHAYHPDHLKVLSCNAVLRPDTTIVSTFYHIAAVDGAKGARPYEWHGVTAIRYDSIRKEEHLHPAHYYCCATIECMNDCGETVQGTAEVAVFPDGTAMLYDEYRNEYYNNFTATEWAESGTLTDVRRDIDLNRYCDGWGLEQMLLNFHVPTE